MSREHDPRESAVTSSQATSPDEQAARERAARRLLDAARTYLPETRVTLAEIEAATRTPRSRGRQVPLRWALAVAIPLLLLTSVASVALSRGWPARLWFKNEPPPATTATSPPAHAQTSKKRKVRLALRGPAKVEVGGAEPTITVEEGEAQITSDELPTEVKAGAASVSVAPGTTITLTPTSPGVWRSIDGASARPATETAAPPLSPPAPTPMPMPASGQSTAPSSGAHAVKKHAAVAAAETPSRALLTELPSLSATASTAETIAETELLREALTKLRVTHDGAGALSLVESHERKYPDGALARVASILRIEALLSVGRQREAWVRLEALPKEELERSVGLRMARAELRSIHGHCSAALADLSALSKVAVSTPEAATRAERVRKSCTENAAP